MKIITPRLTLRPWTEKDYEPFAKMNSDPRVMEFFPDVMSREETLQLIKRIENKFKQYGWGMWAAELNDTHEFIGMIGLNYVDKNDFPAPFTPATEIGWRLAYQHWGKGYATEGAIACLKYGFEGLNLPEIVAFTTVKNVRSRNVMEKLGMHRNPKDDFDHPKIPAENSLRRHVLYRINKKEFEAQAKLEKNAK